MRSRERGQLADMNLHDFDIMTEAKEEGLAEGARQKAVENARNALAMNLTAEQTAQITGLPLDQVLELQKELTPAQ